MNYDIQIERRALKFISKQPQNQKRRILSAIAKLPTLGDIKAIEGVDGLYRLRVGSYRILYTVNNDRLVVCVIDANNRGDVYKRY